MHVLIKRERERVKAKDKNLKCPILRIKAKQIGDWWKHRGNNNTSEEGIHEEAIDKHGRKGK